MRARPTPCARPIDILATLSIIVTIPFPRPSVPRDDAYQSFVVM